MTFAVAPVNAAESAIIYEYKVITQKKGEPFSAVLKKAGLSKTEKNWVNDIPIYHAAKSDRQLRFAYLVENKKRLLKELKVTRGNRLVNFVLTKQWGKSVFVQKPSEIPAAKSKKNIQLQSTINTEQDKKTEVELQSILRQVKLASVSEEKKSKQTHGTTRPAQTIKLTSTGNSRIFGLRFSQAKGQALEDAWQVARLSKLQQQVIKSGDFLKQAKSRRYFTLYFQIDGKKRLFKGLRVSRGKSHFNYAVKKVNGKYKLLDCKELNPALRRRVEKAFATATVKQVTAPRETVKSPNQTTAKKADKKAVKKPAKKTTVKKTTAKKTTPSPSVKKHNSGHYQVISLTQKKGQTLYSALKAAKLTSTQRNLVIAMPATKSAKTTRRLHLLLEKRGKRKYLRALRIVRGKSVAEYVLVKHRGRWTWANEKGQIHTRGGSFSRYPLRFSRITSRFNPRRRHPISRRIRPHKGIDLKAPHGAPIYAPASGVVVFSGRQRGYGIILEIDHRNGYRTKYAHLSRIMRGARKGSRVKKGQLIAKVGNTGVSTGAHLHYEVIVNGRHRNPATVRLPGRVGGTKTLTEAKLAVRHYLPTLRRLSR
ncbi:MAG: hypothetical protein CR975_07375 [Gammaproteobacteria bacterium]|nr:MAG: hypothetical protein CR975_07375 [Gammaproteobacteria bacterium]